MMHLDGAGPGDTQKLSVERCPRSPLEALAALWRVMGRTRRRIFSVGLTRHERQALAVGLFRLDGEVHQWMYDRYSLRTLLESTGFVRVRACSATDSAIREWNEYCLDVEEDGSEYAPSSLYMEGLKPS
jgi:hypothetical protein